MKKINVFHSEYNQQTYPWIVFCTAIIAFFVANLNATILFIAMPAIFRGLKLQPLGGGQSGLLIWILSGYLLTSAAFLVSIGRISDIYGRVKIFTLGFVIFTLTAVALSIIPREGQVGGIELLIFRIMQGLGGATLISGSIVLLTDAFPANSRGIMIGITQIIGLLATFLGLVIGGWLSAIQWRFVFWVSVPFGILGTFWCYFMLHEQVKPSLSERIDWVGNLMFALGLAFILIGLTFGIETYKSNSGGLARLYDLGSIILGVIFFIIFIIIERNSKNPLFNTELFRIRTFTMGNVANFLCFLLLGGGFGFIIIIWLQGFWFPAHGFSIKAAASWTGVYLLPLVFGIVVAIPLGGWLAARHAAGWFAAFSMVLAACCCILLMLIPVEFNPIIFFIIMFLFGFSAGFFMPLNTTRIMNSVPPSMRGIASGIRSTFQIVAMMLSLGIFYSLLIVGLNRNLSDVMETGLINNGLPISIAHQIAQLSANKALLAAYMHSSPLPNLIPPAVASNLSEQVKHNLMSNNFFSHLIIPAFKDSLDLAFLVAFILLSGAAIVSAASTVGSRDNGKDEES